MDHRSQTEGSETCAAYDRWGICGHRRRVRPRRAGRVPRRLSVQARTRTRAAVACGGRDCAGIVGMTDSWSVRAVLPPRRLVMMRQHAGREVAIRRDLLPTAGRCDRLSGTGLSAAVAVIEGLTRRVWRAVIGRLCRPVKGGPVAFRAFGLPRRVRGAAWGVGCPLRGFWPTPQAQRVQTAAAVPTFPAPARLSGSVGWLV
jgi:hypothetical protein